MIRTALTSRVPKTDSGNNAAFGAPEHRANHRKCRSVFKSGPKCPARLDGWLGLLLTDSVEKLVIECQAKRADSTLR
jgi:hypothetical protein